VLEAVLREIVIAAHDSKITPERVLIELKASWIHVCHREPSPDMHDPLWNSVVRMTLDAYDRARDEAA
jgi:hypothetical protein